MSKNNSVLDAIIEQVLANCDDELVARWFRKLLQGESYSDEDAARREQQRQREWAERESERLAELQRLRDEQYARELEEQKRTESVKRSRALSQMKRVLKRHPKKEKK